LAWLLPADGAAAVCKYKIEVLQPSMAGYDYCWVSALNDVGQVTGTCTQDPGEEKRAYDPWNVVSALDINEKGQILALACSTSSTGYVLLHPNDCTVSSSNACCPF